jgi:hypothetical protein
MTDLNPKQGKSTSTEGSTKSRDNSKQQTYTGQSIGGNDHGRIYIGKVEPLADSIIGPCLESPDGHHQIYMEVDGKHKGHTTCMGPGIFSVIHGSAKEESDTSIFIEATNGDLVIKAHNGKLKMYGTDIEMIATGGSGSDKGNIQMTASENIKLEAKKVITNAQNHIKMVSPGTVELAANSLMKVYGSVLKLVDDSCAVKDSKNNLKKIVLENTIV